MMKEYLDLRIPEENANQWLPAEMGVRLGNTVRKVRIQTNDPLYDHIRYLNKIYEKEGKSFFYGWEFIRKYKQSEIQSAKLFHLIITATFEPAGEECGTMYDESTECKICQAGRTQVSDLILDLRKVPKNKDIARTIADEWIVSQRLAQILVDNKITGFALRPVHHKARFQDDPIDLSKVPSGRILLQMAEAIGIIPHSWEFYVWLNRPEQFELSIKATEEHSLLLGKHYLIRRIPIPQWYQLVITSQPIPTIPPTKYGIKPFDEDIEQRFRCPLGHVSGLNLLSELWLSQENWDGSDICQTRDMVGTRRGVLVPKPLLLISLKLYKLLEREKIKGYKVEVAHI
jgi:hypothetical protein